MPDLSEEAILEAVTKVVTSQCPEIDECLVEYVASMCGGLVEEDCFDEEEWFDTVEPVLSNEIEEEDVIKNICKEIITKLNVTEAPKSEPAPVSVETSDSGESKYNQVLVDINPFTLGFMTGRILMSRTRLYLQRGHRYGLVGQNGCGKTTLMRKMAIREMPGFPKSVRTLFVEHEIAGELQSLTAIKFMLNAYEESGRTPAKGTPREAMESLLAEIGFTAELRNKTIVQLSGGWRMRLALARAVIAKVDLLLLDEPTNHLDKHAVAWLEKYLSTLTEVTVVVVSHEPTFLDAVATDILHVTGQKLKPYAGNFTAFTKAQTKFTEDSLVNSSSDTKQKFVFPEPGRLIGIASLTRSVLRMSNIDFSYDKKKQILYDISMRLTLSSRIAVIGPNGAGKSTLVQLMVGDLTPEKGNGNIWRHHNLRVAYVAQHSFHHLEKHIKNTPIGYIQARYRHRVDGESLAAKNFNPNIKANANGKTIEIILGRQKHKKSLAYEIKWEGLPHYSNSWLTLEELRRMGPNVMVQVEMCDERIRATKSGVDQRPLIAKEVAMHLDDFGLDHSFATGKIERLSGGQRSRLVIAAAMWTKPHILVLDEPTNFLDLEALKALSKAIKKFKGGIIMVSHHEDFVTKLCGEVWTVREGRLQVAGAPDEDY